MKEYHLPLFALILLVPIIISPITIEAISVDDEEANAIVQFESPMNVTQWQNFFTEELEGTMKDAIETWGEAEFPSDFKFEFNENHQVYLLEVNQTSGNFIYETNAEGVFEGVNSVGMVEFSQMRDDLIVIMKDLLVTFLVSHNATNGKSFLEFSTGKVVTNEF